MSDWTVLERERLTALPPSRYDRFQFADYEPYFEEFYLSPPQPQAHFATANVVMSMTPPPPPPPKPVPVRVPQPKQMRPQRLLPASQLMPPPPVPRSAQSQKPTKNPSRKLPTRGDSPRELRNKAEKLRRDRLNQSIAELASKVPSVLAANRKMDKTGVLRLTAHYLRAHQYVFGNSINRLPEFSTASAQAVLKLLNGFLLTTTYKGLIVVASQNIIEFLGYSEMDLLGQSVFSIVHKEDHKMLKDVLMPKSVKLGPNGQLLAPDVPGGKEKVAADLAKEKRSFIIRFKKMSTQRSEPPKYVTCHVEGSMRKADLACRGASGCCHMMRRTRSRAENPCASGNDVVFIGLVRPTTETFINESALESYRMEYRTRHSIDGEIIQCEQRISLVTGYMTHEVYGVNAMNFIHKDEVRWVILALQEMYIERHTYGESCYRLITKTDHFLYLRTRGILEIDENAHVTSFVCTNTVVDEAEGKELIRMMKEKYKLAINNNDQFDAIEDTNEVYNGRNDALQDPKQLETQILKMVKNIPSPKMIEQSANISQDGGGLPPKPFCIIAPKRERVISAIKKIYDVITSIPRPNIVQNKILSRPTVTDSCPVGPYAATVTDSWPVGPSAVPVTVSWPVGPSAAPVTDSWLVGRSVVPVTDSWLVGRSAVPVTDSWLVGRSAVPVTDSCPVGPYAATVIDSWPMGPSAVPVTNSCRVGPFAATITDSWPVGPSAVPVTDFYPLEPYNNIKCRQNNSKTAIVNTSGASKFVSIVKIPNCHVNDTITNTQSLNINNNVTATPAYNLNENSTNLPNRNLNYKNDQTMATTHTFNINETIANIPSFDMDDSKAYIPSFIINETAELKYQYGNNVEHQQAPIWKQLQPGPSTTGTKRPIKFDDGQEAISKKKVMEAIPDPISDETTTATGEFSPSIESLIDEALRSQAMDSALNSLDETVYPNFPDFLISQELQDILNSIECNGDEQ